MAQKRTKLPRRTVVADELVIEVDGVEYRPHAGESVTFRSARGSVDDYLVQLKTLAMQSAVVNAIAADSVDPVEMGELESLAARSMERLAAHIVEWTWTDNDGEPYASPPTVETLRELSREEIGWLRDQLNPPRKEEDTKNGDTPSTSP